VAARHRNGGADHDLPGFPFTLLLQYVLFVRLAWLGRMGTICTGR
jgi:hypothetical protein